MILNKFSPSNHILNTESHVIINIKFFAQIIIVALFYFVFFFIKTANGGFVETTGPFLLLLIIPYQYIEAVYYYKKRRFDERERMILYKTIAIASFICVLLTSILYELRDKVFAGFQINNIWGIVIIPSFFLLWGITGILVLKREA